MPRPVDTVQHTQQPAHNVNVVATTTLTSPRALKGDIAITDAAARAIVDGRQTVQRIITGDDPRLLVVVGPCSIHDTAAAMDYAQKLAELKQRVDDKLYIVMRVYFEKPRTTVGWKGLINDPHLDGTFDMAEGLRLARRLLNDIASLGLPTATEMLDPITPQYIDDLVAWAAIGARTTESQTHRQMASGLSMPVGFKNSTDGNLQVAIDAMKSAWSPHHFLGIEDDGRTCIVQTRGNVFGHAILRGAPGAPNYDDKSVAAASKRLADASLNPRLMVDCSHANSGKKHEQQEVVWNSIIAQRKASADSPIMGAMVESNLNEGSQSLGADRSSLKYGVSITDACIGWDKTAELITTAHAQID